MGYIVTGGRILRNTHSRLRDLVLGKFPWDIVLPVKYKKRKLVGLWFHR